MGDGRFHKLAQMLVKYSVTVQPGENVLIDFTGYDEDLAKELIRAVYEASGRPFLQINHERIHAEWLLKADEELLKMQARWEAARMKQMQCYIGVRIRENIYDSSMLTDEINERANRLLTKPVHYDIRVPKTKWVILSYPTAGMAQAAEMPTEEFRDFYFNACCFDYQKMSQAMDPLVELLENADRVKIKGEQVDLSFSIKGIGAVKCDGHFNIPDGEVFTAPVKHSVEGFIQFNTASAYQGKVYEGVSLEFKKGKIVRAECSGGLKDSLNAILDSDPGARYIGEFAFGLHPQIKNTMKDILFDEKIYGSFHFTPGCCYDECPNGNKSAVHWDMVYIMRPEYGGCTVTIDDELIVKDGVFQPKRLQALNRDKLLDQ